MSENCPKIWKISLRGRNVKIDLRTLDLADFKPKPRQNSLRHDHGGLGLGSVGCALAPRTGHLDQLDQGGGGERDFVLQRPHFHLDHAADPDLGLHLLLGGASGHDLGDHEGLQHGQGEFGGGELILGLGTRQANQKGKGKAAGFGRISGGDSGEPTFGFFFFDHLLNKLIINLINVTWAVLNVGSPETTRKIGCFNWKNAARRRLGR